MGALGPKHSKSTRFFASRGWMKLPQLFLASSVALCLCLTLFAPSSFVAQSGRRQKPKPAPTPIPRTGPIAEPTSTDSHTSKGSDKETDEVDNGDVVRISSNLVPIPASIFDQRGAAITGLRLEDFELRVDG